MSLNVPRPPTRPMRSVLCTPATRTEWFEGACDVAPDLCLADLEDSVARPDKAAARTNAEALVRLAASRALRSAIRINQVCELDGMADIVAISAYAVKPDVVMIPKVESAGDVQLVANLLAESCPKSQLLVIVETALGMERVGEIAHSSPLIAGLVFGSADYAADVGMNLAWEALSAARWRVVNAAASAGVAAIDSPTFEYSDIARVGADAERARAMGFRGKVALHPRHVPIIRRAFAPSEDELEQALRIVRACDETSPIATIEGLMVGPPFVAAARRLLGTYEPQEGK